jgi:choline-sulfatase
MKQKNILILMADQLNPSYLGAYGDEISQSPTIDGLAKNGVVFESAYCNSPLCAPSRYSFLTGQLISSIGAFDNAAELPATIPTFAHYLRAGGYRTILAGKMHFCGPEQLHGFEERLTTDIYPADFGWVPDWARPNERLDWYHNMSSVIDAGSCVRTNQLDFDDEVVYSVRQKLFDIARESDERPFLMVASLTHPHDPFAIPKDYWDKFENINIPTPKITQADIHDDPHSVRIRTMCNLHETPVSNAHVIAARRAYYGAINYVDDQFGAILKTLKDIGRADDTIVIVVSDHGEMLGERGLWYKMNFFEGATRVPLIIHAPEIFSPKRISASVSLVDLLPTLIDLTGNTASLLEPIEGESLLPHLHGQSGRDLVIGEYCAEGAIAPVIMIRRKNYKFIYSPADPAQLYDLQSDPHELQNLACKIEFEPVVNEFMVEVNTRWDFEVLTKNILLSQSRRRLINTSEHIGKVRHWDYQPFQDATQRYMRNHIKLDDLEARARFPRVE